MKFSRCTQSIAIFLTIITASFAFPTSSDALSWNLSGHRVIDSFSASIAQKTLEKGYTASLQNGEAFFAIHPEISPNSFSIRIDSIDLLPGGVEHVRTNELHVGPIIEVHHTADVDALTRDFTLRINVNRPGRYNRIWLRRWNEKTETWDRIRNQVDDRHLWAVANFREPGIYAAFESQDVEEGIASWFPDSRNLVVAHNGYPIGSRIRVTNLENAKSIVVTVVSRGPFYPGRVVDLSDDAFNAIRGANAGLARVGVWAMGEYGSDGKVLGETVTRKETVVETPTQTVSAKTQELVSNKNIETSIRATAYAVMNADTGEMISAKNADKALPLASLTKLMTALVVLDMNPDWGKLVTYEPQDNADGAKLYIQYGDKVNVRDLWYSTLVGSANNTAKMLRKSTGLSVEQFRDKMNEKAKALGLSTLSFYEPTGLDHKNVGSASDYVRLAQIAFQNDKIREATLMKTYSFRTAGRDEPHTITSQNKMINSGWQLTGTKTGYTDEAHWCLVARVKGKTTEKNMIAVTLGSPSDSWRYVDMDSALNAGFKQYMN